MKNAIQWKFAVSLSLVFSPALGGCDVQAEESFLDEEVSSRSLTGDKKPRLTLEQVRAEWVVKSEAWLKAHPDATEAGGGCYMQEHTDASTGDHYILGWCCEDMDDGDTCTLDFMAYCPGLSSGCEET